MKDTNPISPGDLLLRWQKNHSSNFNSGAIPRLDLSELQHFKHEKIIVATSGPPSDSPAILFVIGGVCAWGYELVIGHYLEFLKIAKQTSPGSYAELTRKITAEKGVVAIWDGFFPWGSIQAVAKGAVFAFGHSLSQNLLNEHCVNTGMLSPGVAQVVAGGIGGGFQGFVLSPVLLLKTRVMTDPIFRKKMGFADTTMQSARVGMRVIQNEGIAALFKGVGTFSAKRVADWSTRFLFSVIIEEKVFKKHADYKLSRTEKVMASLMGGTLSALSTIPIDVMVAQIQSASNSGKNVGVLETFAAQYRAGGLQGLFGFATKGFVARVAHVALTTAIMKSATSMVSEWYMGEK